MSIEKEKIEYIIFDPSKNITALVISDVKVGDFSIVSKKIMLENPKVEQVGFISFDDKSDISLRMAGSEFCGNATMSAAVYYSIKNNLDDAKVKVNAYSIKDLIDVDIKKCGDIWEGTVRMPSANKVEDITFMNNIKLPVVFFESIAHVIIRDEIKKDDATDLIKKFCDFLNVRAIGFIFVDNDMTNIRPLVYVKSVDTLFWENSCASGSSAVGAYKAHISKNVINLSLQQPGGAVLKVFTDEDNNLYLNGKVSFICKKMLKI